VTTPSAPAPIEATGGLPLAAGVWPIDPMHSGVHFQIRHLGVTNVRGRFGVFSGALTVGETLADVAVEATIDMASVDTNQADRDAHLRGTDFFDVENNPTMQYRSVSVTEDEDGYRVDGELTINGITKPVTLAVEFTGATTHPGDGKLHSGFIATAQVLRDDFGIDFNMPLGVDRFALGKKIDVEIDVQFTAPEA